MENTLTPTLNPIIITGTKVTKVAWVSRHKLTPRQLYLFRQLHSLVIVSNYDRRFTGPSDCVTTINSLINTGHEVYMSPVRYDMEQALRDSGLRWRFFRGYDSYNGYVALEVIEMIGHQPTTIV